MKISMPKPLDDELVIGLVGRFARSNGISSIHWAIRAIRNSFRGSEILPTLWLIAQACEIDNDRFTALHSMLPVLYPISRYVGRPRYGITQRNQAYRSGMDTSLRTFRWCPDCVRDDQRERGFSYWRRQHQIGGMEWCHVHQTLLFEAPADSAIYQPGLRSAASNSTRPEINISEELSNPALARLHKIQIAWLNQHDPLFVQAWNEVINQRCDELGLPILEVGKGLFASNLIQQHFPISWLNRHMPEEVTKEKKTYIRRVDAICNHRHTFHPSLSCASILAAIFETAESALNKLNEANQQLIHDIKSDHLADQASNAFLTGSETIDS